MYVIGMASSTRRPPMRTSPTSARSRPFFRVPPWRWASSSTTSAPTLWRVPGVLGARVAQADDEQIDHGAVGRSGRWRRRTAAAVRPARSGALGRLASSLPAGVGPARLASCLVAALVAATLAAFAALALGLGRLALLGELHAAGDGHVGSRVSASWV